MRNFFKQMWKMQPFVANFFAGVDTTFFVWAIGPRKKERTCKDSSILVCRKCMTLEEWQKRFCKENSRQSWKSLELDWIGMEWNGLYACFQYSSVVGGSARWAHAPCFEWHLFPDKDNRTISLFQTDRDQNTECKLAVFRRWANYRIRIRIRE